MKYPNSLRPTFFTSVLAEALEPRRLLATYFVAPNGFDAASGTELSSPFATIQRAAQVAAPGDQILIRAGTYRETIRPNLSGTPSAPITFRPYQNEQVTISGADVVSGFTPLSNGVFHAPLNWSYRYVHTRTANFEGNQIFANARMMELARWPNQTSSDISRPTLAMMADATFQRSSPSLATPDLTVIDDPAFTDNPARWVGARVWVNLARDGRDGQGQAGTVVSAAAGRITVSGIDTRGGQQPWGVGPGTNYYLFDPTPSAVAASGGPVSLLDPGEWWINELTSQLFLRPADTSPPTYVEARRRDWAFNLDSRSNIAILDLNLFSASITTDLLAPDHNASPGGIAPASDIMLSGLNVQYPNHFTDLSGNYQMQWVQRSGLILSGSRITLRDCQIRFSAGSAVSVIGSENKILNNLLLDTNYSASNAGALNTGKTYDPGPVSVISLDHEIAYNTIERSGSMGINFSALKSSSVSETNPTARIHHNRIHDVMLQSGDSGAIDTVGRDHAWVRIDHNIISNLPKSGTYGIYIDFSWRVIIDHNLLFDIYQPMLFNWNSDASQWSSSTNLLRIYNNTARSFGDLEPGAINAFGPFNPGVIARNNILSRLTNVNLGGGAVLSNNLNLSGSFFVDPTNQNYQLRPTASPAINSGISVAPFNDPLVGAVDLGAFEFGMPPWTAGYSANLPQQASLSGSVWDDLNRNGIREPAEPPLPDVDVYADLNLNATYDAPTDFTYTASALPVPIPDNSLTGGSVSIDVPPSDFPISDVDLTLSITHTTTSNLSIYLQSPDGTRITLFQRLGGTGDNLTNTTFDDSTPRLLTSGSAPYTGRFRPAPGSLSAFNSKLPGGQWRLIVVDDQPGDSGQITALSLRIRSDGEPVARSNASGQYILANLPPRPYSLRQILLPGRFQSSTPIAYAVTLQDRISQSGFDFAQATIPAPPSFLPTLIADGQTQRSRINRIQFRFSDPVTLAPGAITLTRRGTGSIPFLLTPSADRRSAQLTFPPSVLSSSEFGSLPDGIYDLSINSSLITDDFGQFPPSAPTTTFHRLFGDINGDRSVNQADKDRFVFTPPLNRDIRSARPPRAPADLLPAFDFNNDGIIDLTDFTAFSQRLGQQLTY